jgi:hypothetical protein
MDKKTFIELLASSSPENINKIIEEKGKKKLRDAIIIIKNK